MDNKDIPRKPLSNWHPMADPHTVAVIGKLGEEVTDLGSALFRSIIQGIDEKEPETLKPNREWLEEEIADVLAMTELAIKRLGLNAQSIMERRDRKMAYKEPWFDYLERIGGPPES
jgi:hypothetical protein